MKHISEAELSLVFFEIAMDLRDNKQFNVSLEDGLIKAFERISRRLYESSLSESMD